MREGESGASTEEKKLYLNMMEFSLNLVVRFTLIHIMKVRGEITDNEIVVLINSGATNNFITNHVID